MFLSVRNEQEDTMNTTATPTNTLILAIANTGSYEFTIVAPSIGDANKLLIKAWRTHARQTHADTTLMRDLIDDGGVNYYHTTIGQVLRDGSPIN